LQQGPGGVMGYLALCFGFLFLLAFAWAISGAVL
jgi:hypothetical protein